MLSQRLVSHRAAAGLRSKVLPALAARRVRLVRAASTTATNDEKQVDPADRLVQASLREFSYAAPTWSHSLSFATPESDFSNVQRHRKLDDQRKGIATTSNENHFYESWLQSHTFLSPETALGSVPLAQVLSKEDVTQLLRNEQLVPQQLPLPSNLQDAMSDERAVVVTKLEEPFEIVNVNDAWVELCGYSKEESRHESLENLLHGPETDKHALSRVVRQLAQQHEVEVATTVVNYTKTGRKFQNRVRMGPLFDRQNHLTHFVGVLEEVLEPKNTSSTATVAS